MVTRQPHQSNAYLSLGAHLDASDGVCLMELVAVTAGQVWTDAPTCTHPLLAHVARLVNDASSEAGRQDLVELVPALAQATSDDPTMNAQLVLACVGVAWNYRPSLALAGHERLARLVEQAALADDGAVARRLRRFRRRVYEHGPAQRAVESAVGAVRHLATDQRDTALHEILAAPLSIVVGDGSAGPVHLARTTSAVSNVSVSALNNTARTGSRHVHL